MLLVVLVGLPMEQVIQARVGGVGMLIGGKIEQVVLVEQLPE
jgi:hypothetical protein